VIDSKIDSTAKWLTTGHRPKRLPEDRVKSLHPCWTGCRRRTCGAAGVSKHRAGVEVCNTFFRLALLSAFLAEVLFLPVTPGRAFFISSRRSVMQGPAHGFASVLGVALGNLAMPSAHRWPWQRCSPYRKLLQAVKYAGALYLIYLGIQARARRGTDRGAPACTRTAVEHLSRWFRGRLLKPEDRDLLCCFCRSS